MCEPKRIQVTFGVDVDVKQLNKIKTKIENLRPGSVEYASAWDQLKALHEHFLGRLEGECAAYMNIAKEEARQLFNV